jgi:hypothetical protein
MLVAGMRPTVHWLYVRHRNKPGINKVLYSTVRGKLERGFGVYLTGLLLDAFQFPLSTLYRKLELL